jgi:quercetin dioxygenase-like cupin family protein
MTTTTLQKSKNIPIVNSKVCLTILILLTYLLPMFFLWSSTTEIWLKVLLSPVFLLLLVLLIWLAVIVFAGFLPQLDKSVGIRTDRTIRNSDGNYEATFLTTGRESNGTQELIRVEVAPKGGNEWHYHTSFSEKFTVLTGQLTIGLNGEKRQLSVGETATVLPGNLHYFFNETETPVTLLVETAPASGLEKSVRVAYGLANSGQWEKGALFPHNPWHLVLLLGYSESYLPHLPGFIQEPLVNALARIAQWKGEDRDLEVFFK